MLPVTARYCASLPVTAHYCPSLPVTVRHCPLLPVTDPHPCYGQGGLFAAEDIPQGEALLDYAGKVGDFAVTVRYFP